METVCIKLDESILKEIDSSLKKHRYSTRTEFIRDAVRDKLSEMERRPPLTEAEKEELIQKLSKMRGILKRKTPTTDEALHTARERAFRKIEQKFE
ncbi:ribbon-helix-helix protein, CopG family [Candidatus Woesearchaeota archaeon]|nr:ribbon-helix-helix protein, CopG family [Candidatus Woesearchaeota archaeon]